MRKMVSKVPFFIHSTFRDYKGDKRLPQGLQWDMDADSFPAFVPAAASEPVAQALNETELDSNLVRQGIVEAYNRFCYAKDLAFKTTEDIVSLHKSQSHVYVKWNEDRTKTRRVDKVYRNHNILELVEKDASATGDLPPAHVWINGVFVGMLEPDTLDEILLAVHQIKSVKVAVKRCMPLDVNDKKNGGMIRIEKYFSGMIRGYQVFDHLWDNLLALEDPEIVDENTIIGTATLPDWIMGGDLTSRLYVQEMPNGDIQTLRPLHGDDITTSDRKYRLVAGQDDDKIELVRKELARLRYLASLPSPVDQLNAALNHSNSTTCEEDKEGEKKQTDWESEKRAQQHRFNRRKKFTL